MKVLMINKFLYANGGSETYIFKIVLRNIIFKVVNIIYIFAFVKSKDDITKDLLCDLVKTQMPDLAP